MHVGAGLMSYKFRLGLFLDANFIRLRNNLPTNKLVVGYKGNYYGGVYQSGALPYRDLLSFGFNFSADIVGIDFKKAKRADVNLQAGKLLDDASSKRNWMLKGQAGISFWSRFTNYYPNEQLTFFNSLTSLRADGVGGQLKTERVESMALRNITRSTWSPRFSVLVSRYLDQKKSWSLEGEIHYSQLSLDYQGVFGVVTMDSINGAWQYDLSRSFTGSAPFRDYFDFIGLNVLVNKAVKQYDRASLHVFGGVGLNARMTRLNFSDDYERKPIPLYDVLNTYAYVDGFVSAPYTYKSWARTVDLGLFALNQEVIPDFDVAPDDFRQTLSQGLDVSGKTTQKWEPNRPKPGPTVIFKTGFQVELDKLSLGLTYEQSISPVHHIFIKSYQAIFVNLGYKFLRF
jgi:hypothetical protein